MSREREIDQAEGGDVSGFAQRKIGKGPGKPTDATPSIPIPPPSGGAGGGQSSNSGSGFQPYYPPYVMWRTPADHWFAKQ